MGSGDAAGDGGGAGVGFAVTIVDEASAPVGADRVADTAIDASPRLSGAVGLGLGDGADAGIDDRIGLGDVLERGGLGNRKVEARAGLLYGVGYAGAEERISATSSPTVTSSVFLSACTTGLFSVTGSHDAVMKAEYPVGIFMNFHLRLSSPFSRIDLRILRRNTYILSTNELSSEGSKPRSAARFWITAKTLYL